MIKIVDAIKKLKSDLSLEHRIPVYEDRADYYKKRAILESFKNGVLIDPAKGVDLIDIAETTAILLPKGNQIEFARDTRGIYFARIKGGKYYPIDTKPSDELLENSRHYEELTKSFWRRVLEEPKESAGVGSVLYRLDRITFDISYIGFGLEVCFQQLTERLEKFADKMNGGLDKLEKSFDKVEKSLDNLDAVLTR